MQTLVCLIIPPSGFLLDERVFMSLGILRVAAMLEQRGVAVELLDLSGVENFEEVAAMHARTSEASIYGLTATTPQLPAAAKVLQVLRREAPEARMILGGPHITLVNAAAKRERRLETIGRAMTAFQRLESMFDVLVAGDGEDAIFDAIRPDAPKLVDADDPKSALFLTNQRLDALPFPARHLVDVDSYRYSVEGIRALSMIAQLGCPFECGFCGGRESPMLRRVRMRTTENIVKELEQLHTRYGVRAFMLYDDELNVNPKLVELMRAIKALQDRLGVEFRLRGFVKSQLFNEEQAAAMHAAGFRWLLTGFESGSPRILENINKKATLEENTRCFDIAHKHGLKVKALMSIGHPGEDETTVRETKEWLLQVKPDDFDLTIITTYPGTPYYDRSVPAEGRPGWWVYTFPKNGDRLFSKEVDYTEVAEYYKGDPNGGYKAFVESDALTADRLVALRDETEAEVRKTLAIPYNPANPAKRFEASMGQFGLPSSILRRSDAQPAKRG